MTSVAAIGLDIAKSVFQVHGVDTAGQVVIRQRLARRRVPRVFREAGHIFLCSTERGVMSIVEANNSFEDWLLDKHDLSAAVARPHLYSPGSFQNPL